MTRFVRPAVCAVILCCAVNVSRASIFSYQASLDGPSEAPPNGSLGTGFATVDYNDVLHTLHVHVDFTGLTGTTTASHIHAPTPTPLTGTASVATTTPTFSGFPNGVSGGTYDNTLDLTLSSSYNPSFITANGGTTAGAEAALTSAIAQGRAYWNSHSTFAPGGEIRGFLVPVPEPATLTLLGFGALLLRRRR